MRRTKEDAEITRQQLLQAAMRVFGEKGYASTRLSDIADAANVTRGAIYWHFGNKHDLFVALFKERIDPFFEIIGNILNESISIYERIRKMLLHTFDKIENDVEFQANQKLELMDMKARAEFDELKQYMKMRSEKLYHMLLKPLKEGIETGEIKKSLDPETFIHAIGIFIAGFGVVTVAGEEALIYKSQNNEVLVDLFLDSIRP